MLLVEVSHSYGLDVMLTVPLYWITGVGVADESPGQVTAVVVTCCGSSVG